MERSRKYPVPEPPDASTRHARERNQSLSQNLRHHRVEISTLRQIMAVRTMAAPDRIILIERRRHQREWLPVRSKGDKVSGPLGSRRVPRCVPPHAGYAACHRETTSIVPASTRSPRFSDSSCSQLRCPCLAKFHTEENRPNGLTQDTEICPETGLSHIGELKTKLSRSDQLTIGLVRIDASSRIAPHRCSISWPNRSDLVAR